MAMQLFYMPAVTPKAGAKVLIINEKRRMKSEEIGNQVTSFNIFLANGAFLSVIKNKKVYI